MQGVFKGMVMEYGTHVVACPSVQVSVRIGCGNIWKDMNQKRCGAIVSDLSST